MAGELERSACAPLERYFVRPLRDGRPHLFHNRLGRSSSAVEWVHALKMTGISHVDHNAQMSAHSPLLWTFHTFALLSDEPDAPPSVRAQTAVVRTLADALERASPASPMAQALRDQLAEELRRLGSFIDEAG
jgi:hypothetical protein